MIEAPIKGVLFDKDGTLFDFEATWNAWAVAMLTGLAAGDAEFAAHLGGRIGFDLGAGRFHPESPVIAGTPELIVELLLPALPGMSPAELVTRINDGAAKVEQIEAVPLGPLLTQLRQMDLALGVATNDAEVPARAHLSSAGHVERFDFIAGSDSGHGGKPGPGMCLAFAAAVSLRPEQVIMVGDSTHDLEAGHAAGMRTVAVLTGMADAHTLAPLATAVLPDIGHLPEWIARNG